MKIKITVPTSLSDIKLKQYQRWNKITMTKTSMTFTNRN